MIDYLDMLALVVHNVPAIAKIVRDAVDGGEIEEPLASEVRRILPERSKSAELVEELKARLDG